MIPTTLRYFPEVLPEANVTDLVKDKDKELLDRVDFEPLAYKLLSVSSPENKNVEWRVSIEDYPNKLILNAGALSLEQDYDLDITGYHEFKLFFHSYDNITDYAYRYRVVVYKPSIAEKILKGLSLDDYEQELAKLIGLEDQVKLGLLPYPNLDYLKLYKFKEIKIISEQHDVSAGDTIDVGEQITAGQDEVIVLFKVATDRATSLVNFIVDRDEDKEYISLDCRAMPSIADDVNVLIPALKKMKFKLYSENDITGFRVRITYGIAKLTIQEKLRFGLPLIAKERDLAERTKLVGNATLFDLVNLVGKFGW